MRIGKHVSLVITLFLMCKPSRADFKYTQQSKVTGGALVGMTKTLGVFSKNMRQVTEPQTSTTMLKDNRLREERATGEIEIIDLDARRFIRVDPAKKTYTVMTFEEFKAALQHAKERAKEEQAKAMSKHPETQNVKLIPKFDAKATGATRTILGLNTDEMKMNMEMEIQSDDPKVKQQLQSASYWMNSDSWIAPSVPGYDEMRQFYLKMAKELDWLPGTLADSMNMASPQLGPAMDEFRKNAVKANGMPLLQYVSFGIAATGMPSGQGTGQPAQTGQPAPSSPPQAQDNSAPASPQDAISKSLGGMFGGFGKKKKQDQQQQQPQPAPAQDSSASTSGSAPAGQPTSANNSMMDMTMEVTSFSNNSLDKSLFDIPAGYTQVQQNPDEMFGGRRR